MAKMTIKVEVSFGGNRLNILEEYKEFLEAINDNTSVYITSSDVEIVEMVGMDLLKGEVDN